MSVESFENKKSKLELFKENFGKLVEAEKAEKEKYEKGMSEKNYNPHLVEINVEELNDEDAEIWEKFLNRTLTFSEFSKFRRNVVFRAEKKTGKIISTPEEIAVYEKYKKGGMSKEDFIAYWEKEMSIVEFWSYWKKKIAGEEEEKFGDSEENFYAYLDNEMEGDKFWLEKFAEEKGKERKPKKKKPCE